MSDIQQDAANLITWLRLPSVIERQPDAPVMASWLEILLTSVTPDAEELIAAEIESIQQIVTA